MQKKSPIFLFMSPGFNQGMLELAPKPPAAGVEAKKEGEKKEKGAGRTRTQFAYVQVVQRVHVRLEKVKEPWGQRRRSDLADLFPSSRTNCSLCLSSFNALCCACVRSCMCVCVCVCVCMLLIQTGKQTYLKTHGQRCGEQ